MVTIVECDQLQQIAALFQCSERQSGVFAQSLALLHTKISFVSGFAAQNLSKKGGSMQSHRKEAVCVHLPVHVYS